MNKNNHTVVYLCRYHSREDDINEASALTRIYFNTLDQESSQGSRDL